MERPEGAQAPPGDKGGASAAGVRYLLAGAQAWHAQAEACAGQMSAVSTGLRMAMMATGQQVDVDSVAPDAPKVTAAMEEVRQQYPPHRLTSAAMDPSFAKLPPKHGQLDRHVGHSPPTLRNFLQHCLYIIRGMLCPLTCLRYLLRHCLYFIWGMLCPLTCYTAG